MKYAFYFLLYIFCVFKFHVSTRENARAVRARRMEEDLEILGERWHIITHVLYQEMSVCPSVWPPLIKVENKSWWKNFLFCFSFRLASIMGPKLFFLDSVTTRSNGEGQVVCQVGRFGHNQKKSKCPITWEEKVDEKNYCFVFPSDWHQ